MDSTKTKPTAPHPYLALINDNLRDAGVPPALVPDIAAVLGRGVDFLNGANNASVAHYSTLFDYRRKLTETTKLLAPHGLTYDAYLAAACKQPPLFCLSSATVADNILGTVVLFEEYDLTIPAYLAAACKHPSLFTRSPATIAANIMGTVELLKEHGLTMPAYVAAARKQPPLFCQSSATIAANINGTVELLNQHGLTMPAYVTAACKQPSLFYQSPATIAANIADTVELLKEHGLTASAYIAAACKQPSLFYQSPATIAANITGTVELLKEHGLTASAYIAAACKQPPLFYQSPATIAQHALLAFRLQARGFVSKDKNMLGWLLNAPGYLTLANSNFQLRAVHGWKSGMRNASPSALLYPPRGKIEQAVVAAYGFDPAQKTFPPLDSIAYPTRRARSNHRAMIEMTRKGILNGYKAG